jgi:CelD/BcsL family acetyltransferase involved in cellulose biosynthesis
VSDLQRGDGMVTGTSPSAGTLVVRTIDPLSDERWDRFVAGDPAATPFHRSAWIGALNVEHGAGQRHLAVETETGELHGVLPLVLTRGVPRPLGGRLGSRRLASLPRTPLGGPLATTPALAGVLLDAAAEIARDEGALLQVKPTGRDVAVVPGSLHVVPWRSAYVIDLPAHVDDLRFGDSRNHGRISWAVRKAAREGVSVRRGTTADVARWHRLYLLTMRHHGVPARRRRFFHAVLERFGEDAELLLAERGTQLLAGSVFVRSGGMVAYAFNGVDRSALALRPNDLLLWHQARRAVDAGAQVLDLGEVADTNQGLADFKRKWGAREVPLVRYYSADGSNGEHQQALPEGMGELWRRVPLRVTAWAGVVVNGYL